MSGFGSRDQCVINVIIANVGSKSVALASQTARVFNTLRAAQKQARYQYSGEFISVFQ